MEQVVVKIKERLYGLFMLAKGSPDGENSRKEGLEERNDQSKVATVQVRETTVLARSVGPTHSNPDPPPGSQHN